MGLFSFPKVWNFEREINGVDKDKQFIAFNANLQVFEEFSLVCYLIWIGELIGC